MALRFVILGKESLFRGPGCRLTPRRARVVRVRTGERHRRKGGKVDWGEALKVVLEHAGKGGTQAQEVVTRLQADGQTVFQPIFNMCHRDATARGAEKLTGVQGELATAQNQVKDLERQLAEARSATPSTKALQDAHRDELEKLDAKHKAAQKNLQNLLDAARMDSVMARVRTALKGKVDEEYLSTVLLAKDDVRKRIRFTDAGALEITQSGSDIRLTPADGQDLVELFSQDLFNGVPAKWRLSNADAGGGAGGSGAGGGGGTAGGTGDLVGAFIQNMEKSNQARPNPLRAPATAAK